jgi:phage gp36-like protein
MSFSTIDEFYDRFDENVARDLASDTGEPAMRDNPRLQTALDDAKGRILAACLVGRIYSTDDLDGLTGGSLELLKRIECEIAMSYLLGRRPEKYGSDWFKLMDERSEGYLEELRRGQRLFSTDGAQEAGLPTIDGPTAVTFQRLNMVTARTRNFFPSYARRLPLGRGGD